ncbi:MAG: hypothetical protein NT098_00200 [Candidatus Parcubacteria bacterium]|nr:hypothetical protein [Candidatus Parcubacteria bacterium]
MVKKLIFVLLILLSAVSFAGKTDQSTAVPTPKERAAQIINGKTSPYPDILNHRGAPRAEDFVRPATQQPTILP